MWVWNQTGSRWSLGANKGIGKEVARQLALRGYMAWLGCRDEERGRDTEAELRAEGADCRWLPLDVTDAESVTSAAKRIEDESDSLDVLVNNAGVAESVVRHLPSETRVADLGTVFGTNVFGVVAVTNAMLPLLRRSPAGRIAKVSTQLGSMEIAASREPSPATGSQSGLLACSSSKAALNMVTLLYARELEESAIKVNAVSPGHCATDLNDHQGIQSAAEGARPVVAAATLAGNGPSGSFSDANGELPW